MSALIPVFLYSIGYKSVSIHAGIDAEPELQEKPYSGICPQGFKIDMKKRQEQILPFSLYLQRKGEHIIASGHHSLGTSS